MRTNFFTAFTHIDWGKFVWIMIGIGVVWNGLDFIVPPKVYLIVAKGIPVVCAAITYFIRPTVYVPDRTQVPPEAGKL